MSDLEYFQRENLYCLVNSNFTHLDLVQVDDFKGKLEINLEDNSWREGGDWKKIGKYSSNCDTIRLVFDWKNFEHFKEALNVTADFHR